MHGRRDRNATICRHVAVSLDGLSVGCWVAASQQRSHGHGFVELLQKPNRCERAANMGPALNAAKRQQNTFSHVWHLFTCVIFPLDPSSCVAAFKVYGRASFRHAHADNWPAGRTFKCVKVPSLRRNGTLFVRIVQTRAVRHVCRCASIL